MGVLETLTPIVYISNITARVGLRDDLLGNGDVMIGRYNVSVF